MCVVLLTFVDGTIIRRNYDSCDNIACNSTVPDCATVPDDASSSVSCLSILRRDAFYVHLTRSRSALSLENVQDVRIFTFRQWFRLSATFPRRVTFKWTPETEGLLFLVKTKSENYVLKIFGEDKSARFTRPSTPHTLTTVTTVGTFGSTSSSTSRVSVKTTTRTSLTPTPQSFTGSTLTTTTARSTSQSSLGSTLTTTAARSTSQSSVGSTLTTTTARSTSQSSVGSTLTTTAARSTSQSSVGSTLTTTTARLTSQSSTLIKTTARSTSQSSTLATTTARGSTSLRPSVRPTSIILMVAWWWCLISMVLTLFVTMVVRFLVKTYRQFRYRSCSIGSVRMSSLMNDVVEYRPPNEHTAHFYNTF